MIFNDYLYLVKQVIIQESTALPNLLLPASSCMKHRLSIRLSNYFTIQLELGTVVFDCIDEQTTINYNKYKDLQYTNIIVVPMLSQSLIKSSRQLQNLQLQDFKKVVNYSINLILNRENQMKLNQFMQIDEQKGDQITNISLALIRALCKYATGHKQTQSNYSLLPLSKERVQYLKQKVTAQIYELRKIIYADDLQNITHLKDLSWRFEIEVASKTIKNQYTPNIFLCLHTEEKGVQNKSVFTCDFAGLKNFHQSLQQAIKFHGSNKFKIARNSSI